MAARQISLNISLLADSIARYRRYASWIKFTIGTGAYVENDGLLFKSFLMTHERRVTFLQFF